MPAHYIRKDKNQLCSLQNFLLLSNDSALYFWRDCTFGFDIIHHHACEECGSAGIDEDFAFFENLVPISATGSIVVGRHGVTASLIQGLTADFRGNNTRSGFGFWIPDETHSGNLRETSGPIFDLTHTIFKSFPNLRSGQSKFYNDVAERKFGQDIASSE